jgi:flavin reductase (DIM6/NTAB) family NADH-FMN oxidoreductase RutF
MPRPFDDTRMAPGTGDPPSRSAPSPPEARPAGAGAGPNPGGSAAVDLESAEFRRILGHFVTGVTIVTATDPATGEACGLTANAVASVSLDPALVLVCVDHAADSHDRIVAAGAFAVNILSEDQERLSRRFATWNTPEKFGGVPFHRAATGAPILDAALAWVECRIWACYPGGDHSIVVGEAIGGNAREGSPLIYYRSGYGRYTR